MSYVQSPWRNRSLPRGATHDSHPLRPALQRHHPFRGNLRNLDTELGATTPRGFEGPPGTGACRPGLSPQKGEEGPQRQALPCNWARGHFLEVWSGPVSQRHAL